MNATGYIIGFLLFLVANSIFTLERFVNTIVDSTHVAIQSPWHPVDRELFCSTNPPTVGMRSCLMP